MIHQSDYIYALVPMLLALFGAFVVWLAFQVAAMQVVYTPGRWRWGRLGPFPRFVNQRVEQYFPAQSRIHRMPASLEKQRLLIGSIYRWRFAVGPIELRGRA